MSSTHPHSGSPTATGTDAETLAGLRRWNLGLTVLHAAQAVLVLVLAGDFAITVVEAFPEGPPGTPPPAPEALFDVRIGFAVAAFLLLAAIDHGLTATLARGRYERDLRAGSTSSAGWSTPSAPPSCCCSSPSTTGSSRSPRSSRSSAPTSR